MKIFTKYILKQFITTTLLSLTLFVFILLMDKTFQFVNLAINKGIGIVPVFILLLLSMPILIVLAMPMATLAGGILTFSRLAGDSELTAIRTSGSSLMPILRPVILASLIIAAIMIPFNYNIAPASQYIFRNKFLDIAIKNPALRIEESTLIKIPPYTLLCFDIDHKNNIMKEIIILRKAEGGKPAISITARKGTWSIGEKGELFLTLFNGTIKQPDTLEHKKLSSINFTEYTLILRAPEKLKHFSKSIEAMTARELQTEIKRLKTKKLPTYNLEARYHLRGSLAGAVPILLLIGISLGIRTEKKGKAVGSGMGIAALSIYYFLLVAGLKLASNGTLPPIIGVWMPNLIMAAVGTIFFYKRL